MTLFRQKPPCFSYVNAAVLMLLSINLHKKSSEVSIKTRSPPASFSFKGQATKHTTVKWSICFHRPFHSCVLSCLALNKNEAAGDLVLIETSALFTFIRRPGN